MHRQTELSPSETVKNRLRVVYIMGYGRSGSTILDTILGNHPDLESVGELLHAVRLAFLEDEFCACGQRASECPFWTEVLRRWKSAGGDPESYDALSKTIEGSRWQTLRILADLSPAGNERLERWRRSTLALFEAVAAASGKRVLVDSSKNPARALALAGIEELELFLVHLVRDGRGVAWSLAKAFEKDARAGLQQRIAPRSIQRTALAWSLVNRAAEQVFAKLPPDRRLLLRYEDFVLDLGGALAPLESFVGSDLREYAAGVGAGAPLAPGHTIAGNRLRMSSRIELKADTDWQGRMPAKARNRFGLVAGGSLRRYGYAK